MLLCFSRTMEAIELKLCILTQFYDHFLWQKNHNSSSPLLDLKIIQQMSHFKFSQEPLKLLVINFVYLLIFISTLCDTRTISLLGILIELSSLLDLENYTAGDTCGPWITLLLMELPRQSLTKTADWAPFSAERVCYANANRFEFDWFKWTIHHLRLLGFDNFIWFDPTRKPLCLHFENG